MAYWHLSYDYDPSKPWAMTTEHHSCAAGIWFPSHFRLRFHQTLLLKEKETHPLWNTEIYWGCRSRGGHPHVEEAFLALHTGEFRADPAAQDSGEETDNSRSELLCPSGILLKHGGATDEEWYVDVVDESAGEGEWLAGGKGWGCTKTVRRLRYEKTGRRHGRNKEQINFKSTS